MITQCLCGFSIGQNVVTTTHNGYLHQNRNFYGGYDRWGHPVAAGAAAGVAAGVAGAVTSAALGSTVAVLPPSCSTVVVDGIGYSQCGSTWYEPYYSGTTVQYMVVSPPQ
jgi:hypothetical protein